MSNYFVGDVQGCYAELARLLDRVQFDPSRDRLWSCGDLVARGPDSLKVLRLFRQLGDAARVVLGNHDLHLMAVAAGLKRAKPKDRQQPLLDAPDLAELIHWLRQQPLLRHLPEHQLLLSHAGLPPHWGLNTALKRAEAVSKTLKRDDYLDFIGTMYGEKPDADEPTLSKRDQQIYTVNALTRMRFLYPDGRLDFACKSGPGDATELRPWFEYPKHKLLKKNTLVFGHWAALEGHSSHPNAIALDTGCCWGGSLTFWRLEDRQRIEQPALELSYS
ncbi:symmetrical bis(5'-nucleosyl)-tetraphosphatase [Ferrimonas marina]|uniref:Bis(5'-nucleosyl)-tetraphosphatase, symmetrical n=1 Tax=Ferrimonas marina TaxID=299255 RepID=A0A1M5ZLJ2_9GAMM|nr:symmetrical bis(5'-nucleosyl)-tetraphosphatase [Ferrimonas marina]SHI24823.1 Bis(5'nucleosyl)-tetraphosphatase, ApaH [Ferrimonas marina]